MSFTKAAEYARNAAGHADTAALISAGLYEFQDREPRKESELPRLSFEVLCQAVNELGLAVENLAKAQQK